jgi:hypothetical protein
MIDLGNAARRRVHHFADVGKMAGTGSNVRREMRTFVCGLVVVRTEQARNEAGIAALDAESAAILAGVGRML